jgi:hypothetical protein
MTTTPDFRALCEDLLDELQYQTSYETNAELQDRARASLATPPPEPPPRPPTEEELLAMRSWSSHSHTFDSDLVDFARAVLERWGHG